MNLLDLVEMENSLTGEQVNLWHGHGNVAFMTDSEVLARNLLEWFNEGDKHVRPRSLLTVSNNGGKMMSLLAKFLRENNHYPEVCQAFPVEIRAGEIEESQSTIDGIFSPEDETELPFGDVAELELKEQELLDEMPLPGFPASSKRRTIPTRSELSEKWRSHRIRVTDR